MGHYAQEEHTFATVFFSARVMQTQELNWQLRSKPSFASVGEGLTDMIRQHKQANTKTNNGSFRERKPSYERTDFGLN